MSSRARFSGSFLILKYSESPKNSALLGVPLQHLDYTDLHFLVRPTIFLVAITQSFTP